MAVTATEYRYPIRAAGGVDGDTLDVTLDLGFGLLLRRRTRIAGIDTPELRSGSALCRRLARLASERALELVLRGIEAEAATYVCRDHKRDKYGRILGDVEAVGVSLAEMLVAERLGVRYAGGSRAENQVLHRANALHWFGSEDPV